jgi:hypothetical protein
MRTFTEMRVALMALAVSPLLLTTPAMAEPSAAELLKTLAMAEPSAAELLKTPKVPCCIGNRSSAQRSTVPGTWYVLTGRRCASRAAPVELPRELPPDGLVHAAVHTPSGRGPPVSECSAGAALSNG